jgi:anti-sigma factor RsiW
MNWADIRTRLSGLLYGDLPPAEADSARRHLAGCPACRQEFAALQQVRHALDAVPAPAVQVDLPRLYRAAADRQAHRARRWRRAALACCAAAALVLLVAGLRLQVRLDSQQLVVRWGALPDAGIVPPAPPRGTHADAPEPRAPADVEERLQLMSSLIHALNEDLEARDADQRQALRRLQARLDELQLQGNVRWGQTDRKIAAFYAAQFGPTKKGE